MADEPADFAREYFRRLDQKLDRVIEVVMNTQERVTALELCMTTFKQGLTLLNARIDQVHLRLDRLDKRVERIEKRLDLVQV